MLLNAHPHARDVGPPALVPDALLIPTNAFGFALLPFGRGGDVIRRRVGARHEQPERNSHDRFLPHSQPSVNA